MTVNACPKLKMLDQAANVEKDVFILWLSVPTRVFTTEIGVQTSESLHL